MLRVAVLLQAEGQHWQPVAYASRALTKTECKYAQIEKECLGVAFGLERFHSYVYGLPSFLVETDHRPLVSIIKKNLNDMTPRIQRLMMKMQRYDFEMVYTPGKHLVLADALSRAPIEGCSGVTDEDIESHINMVFSTLPLSEMKSRQIAEATSHDAELQHVIRNVDEGWPAGSCPRYYHVRGELSVVGGLLLKNSRIVIPEILRPDILSRIHEGHLGMEKCKRRARESVYWPGINKDIETLVSGCGTCQKHRCKQSKEPMLISEMSVSPWYKVGMDLFHFRGKNYLVMVDYFSNFPEMALLTNTSSTCVITHAKSIFARHGIPHIVVSDNGPCFSSSEWGNFADRYEFCHVTSSPHYAQSNGQAEKGVHILKQLLRKAADSDSDPYLALLSYRATPLQCGLSPAELLMGRKLRTTLPSYSSATSGEGRVKLKNRLRDQKQSQKRFYDVSARSLPPLAHNDCVRIEGADGWNTKGSVLQEVAPRSFTVQTEDGQLLRRNRRSLLKTPSASSEVRDAHQEIPEATSPVGCNESMPPDIPELRKSKKG